VYPERYSDYKKEKSCFMEDFAYQQEDDPLPAPRSIALVHNLKHDDLDGDAEAEYDSPTTVAAIAAALSSEGYTVTPVEADGNLMDRLRELQPELVFNIAEGRCGRGREAETPAVCNLLDIPFIGSDETALCVSMDKALCKRLLSTYGIPSPAGVICADEIDAKNLDLRFPVIMKPDAEGSSKGIPNACIAENRSDMLRLLRSCWERYGGNMLVEEYIHGREFTVGILGNGDRATVFPPMEIDFREKPRYRVYSYEIKQNYQQYIRYLCPAPLTDGQTQTMREYARKAFLALDCHDFTRVDFRMDESGHIYFIEMNPLPGLAPSYSDFPMLAEFCGIPYDKLVLGVLHAGMRRLGMEA